MTELDVRIAELEAHANKIAQLGDRIDEVSKAALTSITLDGAAFGLACSFIVPVIGTMQATALAGMVAMGRAVRSESTAVLSAANAYRAADDALSSQINAADAVEV
ncbi:hypothetical protein ET475_03950 [Microbacterium protaetiae]|uniref:ESX-1 secretion-associated protein n=1 Tax=Microbacterium protaetiae TaxID=2509458 RepID=A0A4P6EMX2_9MICO|nr:type VII secretion target [Microbacterium protaetiae]QAY59228.1 hypothetical protein ET475_03950 [Microbacterium protaetiae]